MEGAIQQHLWALKTGDYCGGEGVWQGRLERAECCNDGSLQQARFAFGRTGNVLREPQSTPQA